MRIELFIRRSYNIWIVIPTIQLCLRSPIQGWEIEFRWLLWGLVVKEADWGKVDRYFAGKSRGDANG